MFSCVTRSLTNVMPCSTHGCSAASSGSKSMMRDALRIDVDMPQKNGQRAPRDGTEADEQDATERRSSSIPPCYCGAVRCYLSFFTSTLELRPLCSYSFPARRRQVVGRALRQSLLWTEST